MRISYLVLVLAGLLTCTGCSDFVSLHPFVTDKEAIQDARLLGTWVDDDDTYIVRQDGKGYAISYLEKKASTVYKLKGELMKAGDATILDLTPVEEDVFRIPVHTPLRVWMEGATLRVALLDSKWMREQASTRLVTQNVDDRQLLTSSGEEVARFLVKYGGDDRAHAEPGVLTRPK